MGKSGEVETEVERCAQIGRARVFRQTCVWPRHGSASTARPRQRRFRRLFTLRGRLLLLWGCLKVRTETSLGRPSASCHHSARLSLSRLWPRQLSPASTFTFPDVSATSTALLLFFNRDSVLITSSRSFIDASRRQISRAANRPVVPIQCASLGSEWEEKFRMEESMWEG